jgi:phosphate transport system substrate-binding protein
VHITYLSTSSADGEDSAVANSVDFAATDHFLTDADYANNPSLQMVPAIAGGIALVHSLQGLSGTQELVLTRELIADIFLGNVRYWNDSRIAAVNPKLPLPANLPITVVYRSDESGTTDIFTAALSNFTDEFRTRVGAHSGSWPPELYATNPDAVLVSDALSMSSFLHDTHNAIGYVVYSDALRYNLQVSAVLNQVGRRTYPSDKFVTAAMELAVFNTGRFTADIIDGTYLCIPLQQCVVLLSECSHTHTHTRTHTHTHTH